MPSVKLRTCDVQSVAIIGAGPSGLAAAKYLVGENAFKRIDIYEQRSRVGGLWDYTDIPKTTPQGFGAPQTSPHGGLAKPIWDQSGTRHALGNKAQHDAQFLSPLYDRLETNIPKTLMGFSDHNWPSDSQLFPKHETVTEYLERYADEVRHLIRFGTQVINLTPIPHATRDAAKWSLKSRPVANDHDTEVEERMYDAVVVASGHFSIPYIPSIPGLKEWNEHYPSAVSHSMYYKKPEEYAGKKVISIGNGASGIDIASQIETTCKWPLIVSQRSESILLSDPSPSKQDRPEIFEFIPQNRSVRFSDGTVESDVDNILFCTGYFYSFPFLDTLDPPIIGDGTHVQNLYQHLFYRPNPTLAFPALQQRIIPFPMAEVQAAVISRIWSGRLDLPPDHEMKAWEEAQYDETGGGRKFHILSFPKDANYMVAMHDWAMSTDSDGKKSGREPPLWGEKEYWLRERFAAIKKAFQDRGEGRREIRTVEELGFDFEAYKRDKVQAEGR